MSGLLLCSSKRGEKPYVIAENEWEIWSLEELCYYLYQNAYSITEEFFSEELIGYLRGELNLEALADRLTACKKDGRNFAELIMEVCQAANYYNKKELEGLRESLRSYAALSRMERAKLLADSYMRKQRYAQALKEYEAILTWRKREHCEEAFIGRIYHNMGIAYGRMLLYHEAEEYLKRALEVFSKNEAAEEIRHQIKRELLLLYYLAGNTRQYEEAAADYPEDERKRLTEEWERIKASAALGEGRNEALIENWKQEYRTQMS